MRLYYTDHFELPLPDGHRFPMSKYRRLRHAIATDERHRRDALIVPPAATDEQLGLAHDRDYIEAVKSGTLSPSAQRRIGFPWSSGMVERSRRSVGATLAAARAAMTDGVAANLAGGTHHATAGVGEGYCVFNDAAVAIRTLQHEGVIARAVVIDLDVHQGNGTASIFDGDATTWTLSMHGAKNFPLRKHASDLDVPLADGTDDETYLSLLKDALSQTHAAGPFDLAIYLAGADPYVGDRLGRLALTMQGLAARDSAVLSWCRDRSLPVAIAMAGGYCPDVDQIVAIHRQTIRLASQP